jgi:hypothetical protein
LRFSDRIGVTQPKTLLQRDVLDTPLKNLLWEVCLNILQEEDRRDVATTRREIWIHFFKRSTDTMPPYGRDARARIREWFYSSDWYDVYNFIEFVAQMHPKSADAFNFFLTQEKSIYRLIDGQLCPISDETEVDSVKNALSVPDRFGGARRHVSEALAMYSRKPTPDYRNAIKEAISAVESAAKIISNDEHATLGDAIKKIGQNHPMHGAFKEAILKLYGYASDENGIRHALLTDTSNVGEAEAHFMIVACSALINYMIETYDGRVDAS